LIFSKETVTAYADRVAGDFHGKQFVLLNVVVDGAAIDINDLSCASNSNDFDVFPAPGAPDFVSENKGRLQFRHLLTIRFGRRPLALFESQPIFRAPTSSLRAVLELSRAVLKCERFFELNHLVELTQVVLRKPTALPIGACAKPLHIESDGYRRGAKKT
jgi:hypothetical protein